MPTAPRPINKNKTKRRPAKPSEKNDPNKMRVTDKMPTMVGAENGTMGAMSTSYKPPRTRKGVKTTITIKRKPKPGPGKNKPTPV